MANRWLEHVKNVRANNPNLSYKEALQEAKKTYTPSATTKRVTKQKGGALDLKNAQRIFDELEREAPSKSVADALIRILKIKGGSAMVDFVFDNATYTLPILAGLAMGILAHVSLKKMGGAIGDENDEKVSITTKYGKYLIPLALAVSLGLLEAGTRGTPFPVKPGGRDVLFPKHIAPSTKIRQMTGNGVDDLGDRLQQAISALKNYTGPLGKVADVFYKNKKYVLPVILIALMGLEALVVGNAYASTMPRAVKRPSVAPMRFGNGITKEDMINITHRGIKYAVPLALAIALGLIAKSEHDRGNTFTERMVAI